MIGGQPVRAVEDGWTSTPALLLLGLTIVSASTDAISYLGLGQVFPANMTGNTVLLGIGLATGDLGAAARSAAALGAFVLGAVAVGAALPVPVARRWLVTVVAVEIATMAALYWWWRAGAGQDAPTGALRYGLVALAGVTMGAQSGLVRALGVSVSTTYITGTWTALSAGVGARLRRASTDRRDRGSRALQALVVTVYAATAYGAGLAYTRLSADAAAFPLGVLLLVAVGAVLLPHADRRGRSGRGGHGA